MDILRRNLTEIFKKIILNKNRLAILKTFYETSNIEKKLTKVTTMYITIKKKQSHEDFISF